MSAGGTRHSGVCARRALLRERLVERRAEIEQEALARAHAIADPAQTVDPTYAERLRATVSAALEFGLAAIERGEEGAPALPPELFAQARVAARNGVNLDTVLRRYFAGYALLGDLAIETAEEVGLPASAIKDLLRGQAALFDRLLAAVSEEYMREERERAPSSEQRRTERVKRLLAGEGIDTASLHYDFGGIHLGAIALGPEATPALQALAKRLDRGLLLVRLDMDTCWAWLGARRGLNPEDIERLLTEIWPPETPLALGEPAPELPGWRLTHRQAAAALPIAVRGSSSTVRYADVALIASIAQDDLLLHSLRRMYLAPLESDRDGGTVARETLRAYFAAGRNVTSAGAALGMSRQAVGKRLRAVEERLGRNLEFCDLELEAILRLEELDRRQNRTA